MRVIVLGGTGTAGRALIQELQAMEVGDISVVSRRPAPIAGVRVINGYYGDLARTVEFRRELARADAIVHLGDGLSILETKRDMALAEQLVAASARVLSAVRDVEVPLFVYLSSIKAICDEVDGRILVEASEPRGTTLYGRSKLCVEQGVLQTFAVSATRSIILRPPVLYGEGQRGSLHRLLRLADTPWPLPLGGLDNRRSMFAVRNLANLLAKLIRADAPPQGVFHAHDGSPLSTTRILTALRTGLDRPRRLLPARLVGRIARSVPFVRPMALRLLGSLELSDERLRRSLLWTPVVDTETALREMACAYRRGPRPN